MNVTDAEIPLYKSTASTLDEYQIDWRQNWKPPFKNIHDLVRSVAEERVMLVKNGDRLVLDVTVSVVWVYYRDGARLLHLVEDKQVIAGSELRRPYDGSVGETLGKQESSPLAAIRGLAEELKFTNRDAYVLFERGWQHLAVDSAEYYPGLSALFHRCRFRCIIDKILYVPEGYVETKMSGKKIYFAWKELAEFVG